MTPSTKGASLQFRFQVYGIAVAGLGMGFLVSAAMSRTGGPFVYTLDDPYIHLAVAETILGGGYGVNAGEFASPSSSVLYPFLLALLLALGVGTWAPLVIGVPAMLASVWLLCALIWRFGVREDDATSRRFAVIVLPIVLLAFNAYALPLTGMEHALHVLAVLMTVTGLARLSEGQGGAAILAMGVVLGPLLRFEGAALGLAGLVALLWYGRFTAAAGAVALLSIVFGAYIAAMSAMGLPILPSSVLVKSSLSASLTDDGLGATLRGAVVQVFSAFGNTRGLLLAQAGFVLALAASELVRPAQRRPILVAVALFGIVAHLAAGRYGWFSRYEIYAVALAIAALVVAWGPALRDRALPRPLVRAGMVLLLLVTAHPYAETTMRTPAASENIAHQQGLMHVFATERFAHPVAVNDLGFVAFGNPSHVLDLWGLGSEEARRARAAPGFGADDLRRLTRGREVVYAMIYDAWFRGAIPPEWCRIATLTTPRVTAAQAQVAFYLIQPEREAEMRAALAAFAKDVPERVDLAILRCADDA